MSIDYSVYENITTLDVQLGAVYYPLLISYAKKQKTVTYGDLVNHAQKEFPDNQIVKNAIAVSTGRRLNVVRIFTKSRGMPDLSALVIGKSSQECGVGFTQAFDPVAVRKEIFEFDWSAVGSEFDSFVEISVKALKPRKTVKPDAARQLMYAYWKENQSLLPAKIQENRLYIIEMIQEGFSAEEAFGLAEQI